MCGGTFDSLQSCRNQMFVGTKFVACVKVLWSIPPWVWLMMARSICARQEAEKIMLHSVPDPWMTSFGVKTEHQTITLCFVQNQSVSGAWFNLYYMCTTLRVSSRWKIKLVISEFWNKNRVKDVVIFHLHKDESSDVTEIGESLLLPATGS